MSEHQITAGDTIEFEGELWIVRAVGFTNEDGQTFVHLAHTTDGHKQKNGFVPRQIGVWI